jgi:hypothetical protein
MNDDVWFLPVRSGHRDLVYYWARMAHLSPPEGGILALFTPSGLIESTWGKKKVCETFPSLEGAVRGGFRPIVKVLLPNLYCTVS